jgi:hypothetical protein
LEANFAVGFEIKMCKSLELAISLQGICTLEIFKYMSKEKWIGKFNNLNVHPKENHQVNA